MPDILHLDDETRSCADLKKRGLSVYSKDPTTDIWLICYAFNDEPVETWWPGEPCPERVRAHIEAGLEVWAHNAAFERTINNEIARKRYGWPELSSEQMVCTMVMAYAMAIPGALEKAAAAMGLKAQKDMAGNRLMLQLAQPRGFDAEGNPIWWNDLEKLQRLNDYCKQDVEVERELGKRLLKLTPTDKADWVTDQKINQRGIPIDMKSVKAAIAIVESEKERLNREMCAVTDGAVSACTSVSQLKDWIGWKGVKVGEGLAKADVLELLEDKALPAVVQRALALRQEGSKSSTAKLVSMANRADDDCRVRGALQFLAAGTGRWAGRGIQIHNFPRGKFKNIFPYLGEANAAEVIDTLWGSPTQVISDCLRAFIYSPKGLAWGDFSGIEARTLAWLAREEFLLDLFRKGEDTYKHTYARSFHVELSSVTDDQRQIGKVETLSLGFGGGKGAFQMMAKNYGVKVSDEEAEKIKVAWRFAHPNIVFYWKKLETAAMRAVYNPGVAYQVSGGNRAVKFKMAGSFLACRLPSGRTMFYPYPKIERVLAPWGEKVEALTYMGEDPNTHKWERLKAYGGLLAENVTQATARDVLAEAISRLEIAGFPVVFHVHDEVACELEKPEEHAKELQRIMELVPTWAKDLPINVKVDHGNRYRK